jgi:hypothetical protein
VQCETGVQHDEVRVPQCLGGPCCRGRADAADPGGAPRARSIRRWPARDCSLSHTRSPTLRRLAASSGRGASLLASCRRRRRRPWVVLDDPHPTSSASPHAPAERSLAEDYWKNAQWICRERCASSRTSRPPSRSSSSNGSRHPLRCRARGSRAIATRRFARWRSTGRASRCSSAMSASFRSNHPTRTKDKRVACCSTMSQPGAIHSMYANLRSPMRQTLTIC